MSSPSDFFKKRERKGGTKIIYYIYIHFLPLQGSYNLVSVDKIVLEISNSRSILEMSIFNVLFYSPKGHLRTKYIFKEKD